VVFPKFAKEGEMTKRFAIVGIVLLAVSLAAGLWVTGTASAASKTIEGRGWLYARGAGIARLDGNGEVHIRGHGVGTVLVCGAEAVRAEGRGERHERPDGCVLFAGWKGKIFVAGRQVSLDMAGGRIEFLAQGSGTAFLKGHGIYRVGPLFGRWTPDGITINYSP